MKLESHTYKNNEEIDKAKHSMYGENLFPGLKWSDVPEGTKSFALFMHDADAPIPSGFWHLQVINISKDLREIKPGEFDKSIGIVRNNDADKPEYIGPGAPEGRKHRYDFYLYALPFEDLPSVMKANGREHTIESSRATTAFIVEKSAIEKAKFTLVFDNR